MALPLEQLPALFNFAGTSPADISFKKGDVISILQRKADWAEGEFNSKRGWFPLSYVEVPQRSPRSRNAAEAADSIVESKDKTKASLGEFFAARAPNKSDFKTKLAEKNIIEKDVVTKKSSTSSLKKSKRDSERRKDKDKGSSSAESLSKSPQESYFYSRRDSLNSETKPLVPTTPELSDKEKAKAEKEKKKKVLNNFFAKRMSSSRPKPRVVEEDVKNGGVCGMSLDKLLALHKDHVTDVPLVINLLIDFIAAHGYDVEGIFRIAGNAYRVDDLSKMFASSVLSNIGGIHPSTDPHVCAELLKKILRDLPEPIFTYKLHDDFIQTINIETTEERVAKMRELYLQLPLVNAAVLKALFAMLIPVAYHSTHNLMTVENISTVFGPTLLRRKEMDFLSGLNDRSKDVVYNFLLDYEPIVNNKPNPEDHQTKLFPAKKVSTIVRPDHMMTGAAQNESSGSLKLSPSEESLGTSTAGEKEEQVNNKTESTDGANEVPSAPVETKDPEPKAEVPEVIAAPEATTEANN